MNKDKMMKGIGPILVFLYQWIIFIPIVIVTTLLTSLTVMIFSSLFGNRFWGFYPPKWWSRIICQTALCGISTSGHEKLDKDKSYIFVANHQGAFDIFLVYGYLNQNIKWVQKQSLRSIPLVGKASEIAGHVFVDNSSASSRARTIDNTKKEIVNGVSIMMFPEGSRTHNGQMGRFKRGAFQIAIDLKLPIVPLTINGPFDVMKMHTYLLHPGKMELIIHKPISTENLTADNLLELIADTKNAIYSGLWKKYK